MSVKRFGFLVLLAAAVKLVAAPPEPVQKPVKLLGLGEYLDQQFAKLTDIGITPSLTYYGVFQENPVGGIQQRSAYSDLILCGVELNFDKLIGLPGGSLTISGAEAEGKDLSHDIGNINTVSEAFVTPHTLLFYELYWKQTLCEDKRGSSNKGT
jgi:carbohydrate-selective porin OprB